MTSESAFEVWVERAYWRAVRDAAQPMPYQDRILNSFYGRQFLMNAFEFIVEGMKYGDSACIQIGVEFFHYKPALRNVIAEVKR